MRAWEEVGCLNQHADLEHAPEKVVINKTKTSYIELHWTLQGQQLYV